MVAPETMIRGRRYFNICKWFNYSIFINREALSPGKIRMKRALFPSCACITTPFSSPPPPTHPTHTLLPSHNARAVKPKGRKTACPESSPCCQTFINQHINLLLFERSAEDPKKPYRCYHPLAAWSLPEHFVVLLL